MTRLNPLPTIALLLFFCLSLPACSNLGYYYQAVRGHLEIYSRREPITELLAADNTSADLKKRLLKAEDIRRYASKRLYLPDNDSYSTYVDLGRSDVLWNVVAAPEFSLQPRKFCFLFAGCLNYKGFFARSDAEAFADGLRQEGNDVYIGGVTAYSTLGWFDDPLLNTMMNRDDTALAGIMFHELAHQKLYIADDATFNESYASAVAIEGVTDWLRNTGRTEQIELFQQRLARKNDFNDLVAETSASLKTLYAQPLSIEQKRTEKAKLFNVTRERYQQIKQSYWHGYSGYDHWFGPGLNNAAIAAVNTYQNYVPAFRALLKAQNGNFEAFHREAAALAKLPKEERNRKLRVLEKKSDTETTAQRQINSSHNGQDW